MKISIVKSSVAEPEPSYTEVHHFCGAEVGAATIYGSGSYGSGYKANAKKLIDFEKKKQTELDLHFFYSY
jgi:hypothetical protein